MHFYVLYILRLRYVIVFQFIKDKLINLVKTKKRKLIDRTNKLVSAPAVDGGEDGEGEEAARRPADQDIAEEVPVNEVLGEAGQKIEGDDDHVSQRVEKFVPGAQQM